MPVRTPATSAEQFFPPKITLRSLAQAAQTCRGCALFANATQTVFGAGPRSSSAIFVGEQPGHEEDLAGKPFVGPAGRILEEALREAEIDREQIYVTNVVKHFKWVAQGKRRLHEKPRGQKFQPVCPGWKRRSN